MLNLGLFTVWDIRLTVFHSLALCTLCNIICNLHSIHKTAKRYYSIFWLLLLPSHFSHVRLYATPQTVTHQAPPSLGFSMQEHWSGLPFPSPMRESEKWKWSCSSCPTFSSWTAAYKAPPSMGFSRQEDWSKLPYIGKCQPNLLYNLKKKKKIWQHASE